MDEQNLKEEVGKNTRTQTQTRKLNEKGIQTFVFIDLGENSEPRYWLDYEDSDEKKTENERDLFKFPIVYPILESAELGFFNNDLTNITTFENNKFNFVDNYFSFSYKLF